MRDTQTWHGMAWHVEGGRHVTNPHPISPWHKSHLNPPKTQADTSRLRITSPTAYKKTCPSRSKERHSCHLVTCTSTRQASSSAPSLQLPPSETKNTHQPFPNRDVIDAFATAGSADCYLQPESASLGKSLFYRTRSSESANRFLPAATLPLSLADRNSARLSQQSRQVFLIVTPRHDSRQHHLDIDRSGIFYVLTSPYASRMPIAAKLMDVD